MSNVVMCLVLSLSLMSVFVQVWDPRSALFFLLALTVSEVFVTLRRKLSLTCPHCHFDPLLYKKSPERACQKVKAHLDAQAGSPMFWMSEKNPLRHLPTRVVRGP